MALSNDRVAENLKVIEMLEKQLVLIKPWAPYKSFVDEYDEHERYKGTVGILKKLRCLERGLGKDYRDYTDLLDINAYQTLWSSYE